MSKQRALELCRVKPAPGVRFAMPYEITRAAVSGEEVGGEKLLNLRGNLWWARPVHAIAQPEILCCFESPGDQKYFDAYKILEPDFSPPPPKSDPLGPT